MLGIGPPEEKSLFLIVCPLKFFLSVCYLGGKIRVVSKRPRARFMVSLSLFMPQLDYYQETFPFNREKSLLKSLVETKKEQKIKD